MFRKVVLYTAAPIFVVLFFFLCIPVKAQDVTIPQAKSLKISQAPDQIETNEFEATSSATLTVTSVPIPTPKPDITQRTEETASPFHIILANQKLGNMFPFNPVKYAIRSAVSVGVPPNTIVLLLLLPAVAAIIAGARHLIGIRGFGIFLPAALSVVFLAIGPVAGIGLFLIIVAISMGARIFLHKSKIQLQYLPRMALILWFVVIGVLLVLFAAPILRQPDITSVSIFPVLILVLLAEEFSKVQLGKSARTAINLTTETLILALVSFIFLTLEGVRAFALLNPEIFLISVALIDILLGRFVGLRFIELWRFRKLISG
ncbi:hypothetical protein IPM62_02025 [Candidatus Woesebacteria bacterium]|nr:MAG: hypothetical protein IPM62_02025 [Candidatus Woesebacteria bacterium]